MKIIIAPDSFKGSLNAEQVAKTIEKGLSLSRLKAEYLLLPMADGGEGTTEIISSYLKSEIKSLPVVDTYLNACKANYTMIDDTTVVLEVASMLGLADIPDNKRDIWQATSYGLGLSVKKLIEEGFENIVIGLGGSAISDAGIGMLSALGVIFYNQKGQNITGPITPTIFVNEVDNISFPDSSREFLSDIKITLLCDVTNVLTGDNGANAIFAPQKGALEEDIPKLDKMFEKLKALLREFFPRAIYEQNQDGAAGGLGYIFRLVFKAKGVSGIDYILSLYDFDRKLKNADLVITGEGKIDHQTINGKVIAGICKRAKLYNTKVIGLAGSVDYVPGLTNMGLEAAISICQKPQTLNQAIKFADQNLVQTAYNLGNLINISQ